MVRDEFPRGLSKAATLLVGLVLLLLSAAPVSAQQVSATLFGTVTDPAGAAIPEATVTALNPATGRAVSVTTQTDGTYVIPSLRPADYTITVEKTGFDKSQQTGVTLVVNQQSRLDIQLKVGTVSTIVEVTSAAPLVETGTASVGLTIDAAQVTELPLNIRRFGSLPLLMPGTVQDRGGFSTTSFGSPFSEDTYAANGARGSGNNILFDGVDAKNMFTGGFSVQPSPDAIQEFKVQTESFSAVFGKNGGSTINLVTKSGTNDIHGNAFEFLRNNHLDARNFFDQTRPSFQRNQFGAYVGGPIKKNKTFFFGGYDAERVRKGLTYVDTIPTPLMRTGDFSELLTGDISLSPCVNPGPGDPKFDTGAIFDPTTIRQITCANPITDPVTKLPVTQVVDVASQFQGNKIASIDPIAQKVLPFFPAPNAPGLTNNYIVNPLRRRGDNQFLVKVDQNFSDKDKMFVRYLFAQSVIYTPEEGYTSIPGFGDKIRFRGQNAAFSWTHTFGPTVLNEARVGFSRNMDIGTCEHCPRASGFMDSFGIPGLKALSAQDEGFPFFGFGQGYTGIGDSNYRPVESNDMIEKYYDALTLIRGKHTLTTGVDIQPYQSLRNQAPFSPHGQFSYNGQYTNFDIADFLLGYPDSVGRSVAKGVNNHDGKFWNAFVQDDYRATGKLTINLGLRWEYHQLPTDRRNVGATLFPIPGAPLFTHGNALLVLPGYAQADAYCNLPQYFDAQGDHLIACSSDMKKYGFNGRAERSLWFPDHFNWAPRVGFAWRPTNSDRLVVRAGYGLFFELSEFNAFHYGFNNPVHGASQFNSAGTANIPSSFAPPAFTTSTAFTSAAVPALKDSFLSLNVDPNFRQPYINEWDFGIESQLSSNMALEVRYLGTSAAQMSHFHFFGNQAVPGPGADTDSIQARRYYPDFGFTAQAGSGANSNYNSLQVQFTKKMSRGLSFLAGYTWAKQITNNEGEEGGYADGGAPLGQDDNHQGIERAPGVNDVRHRFTVGYIWEVPLGHNRHWLSHGRAADAVLGNWKITGDVDFQTGFPITPLAGFDIANTGTGSWRPDRICNGAIPAGQRTVARWFDTSCFTTDLLAADQKQGVYRFGNSGRSLLDGPGLQNWNFGFLKDIHVSERVKVQFRAEFFNAFNQAHFSDPSTDSTSGNYNQITGAGEPRDIQFALKFLF